MFSDCHCPNRMYKLHFIDSQNTTKHKKYTVNYLVCKLVVTFLTPSKPTKIIQPNPLTFSSEPLKHIQFSVCSHLAALIM